MPVEAGPDARTEPCRVVNDSEIELGLSADDGRLALEKQAQSDLHDRNH
jgi:hypothetical protein